MTPLLALVLACLPAHATVCAEDVDLDGVCADIDCDDLDPAVAGPQSWYGDDDGDGHGDPLAETVTCAPLSGEVAVGDDCDDDHSLVHPGAIEVCNELDDDCDETIDVGAADAQTFWVDEDGDGYGDAAQSEDACTQPVGYVANDDDCDDAADEAHPGAVELCDGIDGDCDGAGDEGAIDAPEWYPDADGDGFGDGDAPVRACEQPSGTIVAAGDCDDSDPTVTWDCTPGEIPPPPSHEDDGSCGCAADPSGGSLLALALALAVTRRRR